MKASGPTDSARSYRHVPYRSRNGRNGPGRARRVAAASYHPRCCGGRPCRRSRLVRHVDLRGRPDGAHGALPVAVDGPRPLLRPARRHDGRDDVALGAADDPRVPRDDAPRSGSTDEARRRRRDVALHRAVLPRLGRAFGVGALLALMASGLLGAVTGPFVFASAVTLVTAGVWQVTRTKEVCLTHCTSPMSFVLHHWRSGRIGAIRMGFRHSLYCIGCCWLFMLVLFISGSMSLLWMGGLSVVIFAEKLGVRTTLFSRVIGVLLVALGALAGVGAFIAL